MEGNESHDTHDTRIALIERNYADLSRRIDLQTQATRDLVDAWNSARGILNFVQLLAKVGAACGAIYLLMKGALDLARMK